MQRIPEPELMDGAAQALAYAQADFSAPHDQLVAELGDRFPEESFAGTILDLGCGPADVSIRVARAYPAASIHGVDGAQAMLDQGELAIGRAELGDRVTLHRAYLPDEPPPRDRYDAVISNSLLHHLAEPSVLWRSIVRYAAPGAPVFVMDLYRPESRERALELVETHAAGEPEVLRTDFLNSLLAAYTIAEVRAQLTDAGLGRLTVEATTDRHFVVYGRAPRGAASS